MIIEPAKGSPTTRAPARASTAMMSTLSWRRLIAATVQVSDASRPRAVPAFQTTAAADA